MSLTTDVTPFEVPVQDLSTGGAGAANETAAGLSPEEEQALLAETRERHLRDTVRVRPRLLVRGATLRLRGPEALARTAKRNGFRLESEQRGHFVLRSSSGDRLELSSSAKGGVRVRSTGAPGVIQTLVREHTREVAVEYLRKSGFEVQEARLPNGEVQIVGQGQTAGQPAQVAVQVRQNGTYWADVEKTRGPACARVMEELVEATGGHVVATDLKPTFHARTQTTQETKARIRG